MVPGTGVRVPPPQLSRGALAALDRPHGLLRRPDLDLQAVALGGRTAAPVVARAAEEDEPELETAGPEMVSLEEVEASESDKDMPIDEDIDVGDDVADDTFLEEEEEGEDDVSDLIDGDIEDDEEA